MCTLFLNDSPLYPENIQLLKNLTNHLPYWLGGFFFFSSFLFFFFFFKEDFSIKSLIQQEERLTVDLGYIYLKLMDRSERRFPLGNYWHQKLYTYMWLDELT